MVWLYVDDMKADDWEIKPKVKTFGEICYEAFVGTRQDEFGSWEHLNVKSDYERAARAVIAAAKEREEAGRA